MNNILLLSLLWFGGLTVSRGAEAGPLVLDFEAAALGPLPEGLMLTDAESQFAIVADGANHVLEMSPAPLVDGGVLLGASIKGGVAVRARIRATGKRRSFPRFGVGLHGVGGYRCLVVPARKELQIVRNEEVVAQVPYVWKSGSWTVVEFSVLASAAGGSKLEARAWEEGQPRPEAAQLSHEAAGLPGTGKASLWAAPYAELPIAFDDVVVTPTP